jgi:hypothetical protein
MADATVDQATKLESQTSASLPLKGIVPDGGLHPAARAADTGTQTLVHDLLGQLGNKLNVGGQTTNPNSNARAQDPLSGLMEVLQQIAAQLRSGG